MYLQKIHKEFNTKRRKVKWNRVAYLLIGFLSIIAICVEIYHLCEPKEIGIAETVEVQRVADYEFTPLNQWEIPEQAYESLGMFKITYYCPGACCNGSNAGVDCKGNPLVSGTIATNDLPYGTVVYINLDGVMVEYTVRDRMRKKERKMPQIDIFMDLPHETVQNLGVDYAEVFIKK